MKALPPLLIVFLISGCATLFGGDLLLDVTGTIPIEIPEGKNESCELAAYSAVTDEAWGHNTSPITPPEFLGTMMIPILGPKHSYYFVAKCGNNRTFRSEKVFVIRPGRVSIFDPPLDIGVLTEVQNH